MAFADDLVLYYQNLLPLQYRGKAKARADVDAVVRPILMDGIALSIRDAYDIDTAVGVQLDVIGKYVGVVRTVKTFTSTITLSDDDFRQVIKMKIFKNNSTSSLDDIDRLIQQFFPGQLQAFDHGNMHMSYFFLATAGSADLAEAFVVQKLLPRPMGVALGALVYAADLSKIFSFRTTELPPVNAVGFNSASAHVTGTTWLNGSNMITL